MLATLWDTQRVIYYGASGEFIKIGFTERALRYRTSEHRRIRPDYVVLAARDGDLDEEARTHRMFRHLLVDGEREWFHSAPELLAHLCTVARGDYSPVEVTDTQQPARSPRFRATRRVVRSVAPEIGPQEYPPGWLADEGRMVTVDDF